NVRPGDVVQKGQVLASMDTREIRWELAGLKAEHAQAAKKRDVGLANEKVDEMQLNDLEVRRLALRIKLLQHREDHLAIKSQLDGIVLTGDHDGASGVPVREGDPLYEIALTDPLRLELAVDDADIAYVEEGMQVHARLEGHGSALTGVIDRVHPQASVRDSRTVFVVEVLIENEDGQLRPGMRGDATIMGSEKSLGWIAFHKAWSKFCAILGW
ncbi:MAG: efflux RND transporter periplasmic adaptor subunit, partial [Pirellulales bacterium]|nr:efflux RND transporter periplasmic adaptor subunit [Pirellulales bacterium]